MKTDWDKNLPIKDIDTVVKDFNSTILNAALDTIPTKTVTIRQRDTRWVTADLKRMIRKRDRLFKWAKISQTVYDWRRLREQRNLTTTMTKQLKQQYIQTQVSTLLENKQNPTHISPNTEKYNRKKTGQSYATSWANRWSATGKWRQSITPENFFAAQSNIHVTCNHPIQMTAQIVPPLP